MTAFLKLYAVSIVAFLALECHLRPHEPGGSARVSDARGSGRFGVGSDDQRGRRDDRLLGGRLARGRLT